MQSLVRTDRPTLHAAATPAVNTAAAHIRLALRANKADILVVASGRQVSCARGEVERMGRARCLWRARGTFASTLAADKLAATDSWIASCKGRKSPPDSNGREGFCGAVAPTLSQATSPG
jgi:hypothetical protein